MTDPTPSTDRLEETFALLADGHRVAILAALWGDGTRTGALSFSDLRERVGMADSGQFNYHLDQLRPAFVRRSDDGYALTHAGRRVMGLAASGDLTESGETATEPVAVGECQNCGGEYRARYDRGGIVVDCSDCDTLGDRVEAPPIVASAHDREELPAVFGRRLLTDVQELARGFCTVCRGPVERSLVTETDVDPLLPDDTVEVIHDCRGCGCRRHSGVTGLLLDEPAVIAFLHEAGIDLREAPLYELLPQFEVEATVVDDDPVRVESTVARDGEAVTVSFDSDLSVVETERV